MPDQPYNPSRRKSRRRALDVLYSADLRDIQAKTVLADTLARMGRDAPDHMAYAVELVEGVEANATRIDELLTTYSQGWSLDRMPGVDLAVLRLGTFELLWRDDVPDAVVINEAVELARALSTDDSPGFVNGLLGRLLDLKPSLVR